MKGCNLQRCTYIVTISDDVIDMLHIMPLMPLMPFVFSPLHPCVPGQVLDEADRMFHMGFEYQAFWILEGDPFGLDDCEASCQPCHTTGSIVLGPDRAVIDHGPPLVLILLNLASCVD